MAEGGGIRVDSPIDFAGGWIDDGGGFEIENGGVSVSLIPEGSRGLRPTPPTIIARRRRHR